MSEYSELTAHVTGAVGHLQDAHATLRQAIERLLGHEADLGAHGINDPESPLRKALDAAMKASIEEKFNSGEINVEAIRQSIAQIVSDAVNSSSSTTLASSKAVKLAYDLASQAKSAADAANNAAATAQSAANAAKSSAQAAQTTASGAVPKSGARGALAGSDTSQTLTGSQTITINSQDSIVINTSGSVTLTFTPAAAGVNAVKVICLNAQAATALAIAGASWASKGAAPAWGDTGRILVLTAHFIFGKVILNVTHNSQ